MSRGEHVCGDPRAPGTCPCAHMLASCPEGASPAAGSDGSLFNLMILGA